jgi:hypothetical protein
VKFFFFFFFSFSGSFEERDKEMGLLDDLWKIPLLAPFYWEFIFSECHFSDIDRERERDQERKGRGSMWEERREKRKILNSIVAHP